MARRFAQDGHRVRFCHTKVGTDAAGVEYDEVEASRRGVADPRWRRVFMCGSVWECPVCSARLAEHRRGELITGLSNHLASGGGSVLMMTLTYAHALGDKLSDQLESFAVALSAFKGSRAFRDFTRSVGSRGSVRALETRHGANGWHTHSHELIFATVTLTDTDVSVLTSELAKLWASHAVRADLGEPSLEHGLNLELMPSDPSKVSAYVTKFAGYLTAPQQKRSAHGSRSPWQILASTVVNGVIDFESVRLWQEYAAAFKGRRSLFWSRGLRTELGLGDNVSDQLVLEEEDLKKHEEEEVIRIPRVQYEALVREGLEFVALDVFKHDGADAFRQFCLDVYERRKVVDFNQRLGEINLRRQIEQHTRKALARDFPEQFAA